MEDKFRCIQEFNQMGEVFFELLEKTYDDKHFNISNGSKSKDFSSFQVSFDGIFARINEEEEIEINIGQIHYAREPLSNRIQELQSRIEKVTHDIFMIKSKFKELIDMAGDIPSNVLELLFIKAETTFYSEEEHSNRNLEIIKSSALIGLESMEKASECALEEKIVSKLNGSVIDSCKIGLESEKNELVEVDKQLLLKFGSLSISIDHESEQIKKLKRDILYSEYILEMYYLMCREESLPGIQQYLKYINNHEKGIAIKMITQTCTFKGFKKGNCIDDCHYENTNGSKMYGKMVNGFMFGKGSYKLIGGKLFIGEILENLTASGEMFNGNMKITGTWDLILKENIFSFKISGEFTESIDGRLDRQGRYEEGKFIGTVYKPNGVVATGTWNENDFEEVQIYKTDRVTHLICHSKTSYSEVTYKGSILISKFTVVDEKKEGDAYFKTEDGEKTFKFEKGIIVWAKIKIESLEYEGFIKENKFHGRGKLENGLHIYSGEFENGIYHGQGSLEGKTEDISLRGIFNNGRMINGVLKSRDIIYEGQLNSLYKAEGHGTLNTPRYKYTGEFKNDKFHGEGSYEDKISKKIGKFEAGVLVSGTLTQEESTWTGTFNPQGKVDGKATCDSPDIYYDGEWKNSNFHGQGTLLYKKTGRKKTGRFEHHKIVEGELVIGDVSYTGTFNNEELPDGHGTRICPQYTYTGYFAKGRQNGRGKKVMKDGAIQEGDFKDGTLVEGSYKGLDQTYIGSFSSGRYHGQGKWTFIDGSSEEGQFHDAQLVNGVRKCQEYTYTGALANGVFHGKGRKVMRDGTSAEGTFENGNLVNGRIQGAEYTYEGDLVNGEPHGQGKEVKSDGTIKEGSFKDGFLVNGRLQTAEFTYTGAFANGNMNGYGTLLLNGFCFQGNFLNGKQTSGTVTLPDGTVHRVN